MSVSFCVGLWLISYDGYAFAYDELFKGVILEEGVDKALQKGDGVFKSLTFMNVFLWLEPYAPLNPATSESSETENEDFGYDEF